MSPDEARAIIAAGRAHDDAMSGAPWRECCSDQDESHPCRLILGAGDGEVVGSLELDDGWPPKADLAGIAWMRTNLPRLLTGYAEALAEVERLRGGIRKLHDAYAADRYGYDSMGFADELAAILEPKP